MAATSAGQIQFDLAVNAQGLQSQVQQAANGVNGIFAKLGRVIGGYFGARMLLGVVQSCTEAASAINEVQNVVDMTFPHMSQQMETWSQNAIEAFGMSELMAKRYASRLGGMARASGMSEEAAFQLGTGITELAGDVASFYDLPHDEVYSKLTSIFTGQVRPLMDLGVVMNQAELDAYALANGFGRTTSEMDAAEKAVLRYNYVLNALAPAQGDFARTSGSWANQIRLLQVRFESLKATMGQSFIAVLLPVVRVLNAIVAGVTLAFRTFNKFIELITGRSMGDLTGGASAAAVSVGNLGGSAGSAAESTDDLAGSQGRAAKAAKDQTKAQKELNRALASFDKINKLSSNSDNLGAGGSGGGGGIGGGGIGGGGFDLSQPTQELDKFQQVLDKLDVNPRLITAFQHLGEALGKFGEIVRGNFERIWTHVLVPFGKWTINEALPPIIESLASAFDMLNVILETLGKALQPIWDNFFAPIASFMGDAVAGVLNLIADALGRIAKWAQQNPKLFTSIATGLLLIWQRANLFKGLTSGVAKLAGLIVAHPIAAILTAIALAAGYIYTNWDKIKKTKFGQFLIAVGNQAKKLGSVLSGALSKALEWASKKFKEFQDFLKSAKTAAQPLINALKAIAGTIESVWKKLVGLRDAWNDFWGISSNKNNINFTLTATDKTGDVVTKAQKRFESLPTSRSTTIGYAFSGTESAWTSSWTNRVNKSFFQVTGDKARKVSYQFTNTEGAWKSQWTTRVNNAFYNKTGGSSPKISYQFSDTESAWKSQWNSRVNRAFGNKTVYLAVEPYLTKTNIKMNAKGGAIKLTAFAEGGFVERNTPRLAIIGDNRREGEIVSPESKFQAMLDKASANGGGNAAVEGLLRELIGVVKNSDPNIYLDSAAITRAVVTNINRETQTTGRSPIYV